MLISPEVDTAYTAIRQECLQTDRATFNYIHNHSKRDATTSAVEWARMPLEESPTVVAWEDDMRQLMGFTLHGLAYNVDTGYPRVRFRSNHFKVTTDDPSEELVPIIDEFVAVEPITFVIDSDPGTHKHGSIFALQAAYCLGKLLIPEVKDIVIAKSLPQPHEINIIGPHGKLTVRKLGENNA